MDSVELKVKIKNIDEDLREIEGAACVPNLVDAHGEYIDIHGVRALKKMFEPMEGKTGFFDTDHDNIDNGSYSLKSYINGDEETSDDYPIGTWVVKAKVPDDDTWEEVKNHEINAYSMHFRATEELVKVQALQIKTEFAVTDSKNNDHEHKCQLVFDENGICTGMRTDIHTDANGIQHWHEGEHATHTNKTFFKGGLGISHDHRAVRR